MAKRSRIKHPAGGKVVTQPAWYSGGRERVVRPLGRDDEDEGDGDLGGCMGMALALVGLPTALVMLLLGVW